MLKSALDAPEESEEEALEELETFLRARIRQAETQGVSSRTVDEIFDSVCAEKGIEPQHG